ncbi:hypothetical protein BJ165DRAFT_1515202 [Panaeolus papilionaceus]|nr:hypothetical protein BJ165DRAFT_1515202 [Panaeolus papilionaceus]
MESKWDGLRITGPVSLEQVKRVPYTPATVLLMGEIGSGKSHFIETLAKDASLGISKDQLDGGTHEITAYKVLGLARVSSTIYLIDTPGFSNPNTSELKIVDMIRNWVDKSVTPIGYGSLSYILYFERITDTRSTATKTKLASLLRELLGTKTARSVTLVTTRWDEVKSDAQRQRADCRFEILQSEHWKDILNQGAKIVKFQNTQASAFTILRDVLTKSPNSMEFAGFKRHIHLRDTTLGSFLQQNLAERIHAQVQRLNTINEDLQKESTVSDIELHFMLLKEKADIEKLLERLQEECAQCRPLPPPKLKPQSFGWFGLSKPRSYHELPEAQALQTKQQ